MKKLDSNLLEVTRGGSWGDFACGVAIGIAFGTGGIAWLGAVATCGWAYQGY